ncbi:MULTISPECIES: hypothetical protein [unclassified Pseudomonas]|uniref:hypothetical protein n=1 Tax=unclassified Pseudomonas TaxID=196821 RepID=UPI002A36AEE0|nr:MULTISPECIES: hypothetical protein [unclassified Pseudomonas]MDX9672267.1 hypothetical protein [Pseudomonas sp. P8_250]WPN33781.1 hypothetical protein QMK53_16355 [Pseudomonas sp. P8_139]WPN39033.1 hypothetical protein QMK55_15020 [Pseudomonas sp. P8_229]
MTERSVQLHQSASSETANFDRFVLGASMAACAYLAQTMPFGPIGTNVSTMYLATLLIMGLSAVFGFLRIEATISTMNANSSYLHMIEMGELNDLSMRHIARQAVDKVAGRTKTMYVLRNRTMLISFFLYVATKVYATYPS